MDDDGQQPFYEPRVRASLYDSWIVFFALLARERKLALRERSGLWLAPSFVLLASATLAFGVSKLSLSSPVLYAANSGFLLCFACMLGLEGWLTRTGERESLVMYALSSQSWLVFVVAKFASFLLLQGVPAALAMLALRPHARLQSRVRCNLTLAAGGKGYG